MDGLICIHEKILPQELNEPRAGVHRTADPMGKRTSAAPKQPVNKRGHQEASVVTQPSWSLRKREAIARRCKMQTSNAALQGRVGIPQAVSCRSRPLCRMRMSPVYLLVHPFDERKDAGLRSGEAVHRSLENEKGGSLMPGPAPTRVTPALGYRKKQTDDANCGRGLQNRGLRSCRFTLYL
ncbi:hypothetical protein N657DRAFT_709471 [Parathielavia appendiculata]|uniref:Uncharacterized protein n=1 Tax=Parathielavia appendiculata TaxID=2587402 RepID=A0AAN6U6S1_9PEZI|nr:hypothetical protein N657DRAFT_709471 [Parathielavia appendiculata]